IDGDGDLDALIGDAMSGMNPRFRLFENDGAGQFSEASARIPVSQQVPMAGVAFTDIDGDGDLDLLFSTPDLGLRVLSNDGSGHFTETPETLGCQIDPFTAI